MRKEKGIKITVSTFYEADFSKPHVPSFIFSYKIKIINELLYPVKLESREWIITDSNGEVITVKGEGVVGLTPEIPPGGKFEYSSNLNLKSGLGRMKGRYFMRNTENGKTFTANIEEFKLEADFVLN